MQVFFNFDKHSPWETSPVPLTFFASALKTILLEVIAFSLPELINFSVSEGPGVEFPDARNYPEKIKKWEMAHKRFCFWYFKNFKSVLIDLELNSASGNQTYFYQKCGSCTQKSNKTWTLKVQFKTKKETFVIERLQIETGGTKILVYWRPQDSCL